MQLIAQVCEQGQTARSCLAVAPFFLWRCTQYWWIMVHSDQRPSQSAQGSSWWSSVRPGLRDETPAFISAPPTPTGTSSPQHRLDRWLWSSASVMACSFFPLPSSAPQTNSVWKRKAILHLQHSKQNHIQTWWLCGFPTKITATASQKQQNILSCCTH